ncbi:MAG: LacI family DNA-binding transcriptional regulator [Candidatus Microbacterium stercoravium]
MPKAAHRPATAADVAARAGVSRATVSHIFTGRASNFTEATRAKVLSAASELDYRPSAAGRSLVLGRGDTIVALAPKATIGQNHLDALDRLAVDTAEIGANVVLRFADTDHETTTTALLRMQPLAVIDLGVGLPDPARARLAAQGVPIGTTDPHIDKAGTSPYDDLIAEAQVTELTRHGARHIVYASLDDRQPDRWGPARFAAIHNACSRHNLEEPTTVRVSGRNTDAVRQLDDALAALPAGIACFNDDAAIAVMSLANQLGHRIPDEVAVVGVDATPLGQLVSPRLTTLDVNIFGFMDNAVTQLSAELGLGIEIKDRRTTAAPFTLIRGDST